MSSLLTRECPRDHTRLVAEKLAVRGPDVTIDRCPKCGGIFLDKNELARITGDVKLNAHLRDEVGHDSDTDILCPSCGGIMDGEDVGGATVDVCLTCFGLWLDRGELDTLKARPNAAPVEVTPEKAAEIGAARGRGKRRGVLAAIDRPFAEFVRRYL